MQTRAIVACHKTAVSSKYHGIISPSAPPYSVITPTMISAIQYTTVTTYKILNIEYDKSESGWKIWKCPHCNEEVRVINKKAGERSQEELINLEEEHNRPRRKWRIILPAIFIISLGVCLINPGTSNANWGIFLFIITPLVGLGLLMYAFVPFKNALVFEEQESGYVYIENPQAHTFLVSADSWVIDFGQGNIGYESPQPVTPESRLQNVGKIIHKVWVKR